MALRRITAEFNEIFKEAEASSVFELSKKENAYDNKLKFNMLIKGPVDTAYEGGLFEISFDCIGGYPLKAPEILCTTLVYHPNVDNDTHKICLDINKKWTPKMTILSVLNLIQDLFRNPNTSESVNPQIAEEFSNKKQDFEKMAKFYVSEYGYKH